MLLQKFFHLDCGQVIQECGFQCDRCIQEIRSVLGAMPGVSDVSMGKHGEISGIVVQFDSETIGVHDLMNALSGLPSFYQGFFVPKVLDSLL